jgi:nicotinate-nucleotide pyrophosphorylase (carboxylating)
MFEVDNLIKLALDEDIGIKDLTTASIISPGKEVTAKVIANEDAVLSGIDIFCKVFTFLNSEVKFKKFYEDGDHIKKGAVIANIICDAVDLLRGERVALNFMQRLSGIASLTHMYVEKVKGYNTKVVDTRKTTPGWRSLEKYAVKMGGGMNHRSGLFDGVLIKDNHIRVCGGISQAVKKARCNIPHIFKIEIEVKNLDELREAIDSGVEVIMLDNMDIKEMEKAVQIVNKRTIIEASGGINLDNIVDVAKIGVDIISIGALTHSARAYDISMDIV